MKKMKFKGWNGVVVKVQYRDGSLALALMEEGDIHGSLITAITLNLGIPGLEENEAFVKDYSENSGMLDALKEAGLVKEILGHRQSGFVTVPLVKFNLDGVLTDEELNHKLAN